MLSATNSAPAETPPAAEPPDDADVIAFNHFHLTEPHWEPGIGPCICRHCAELRQADAERRAAAPPTGQATAETAPHGFHFTEPRRCVECEACGFAFDATHTDEPGGGYTCPLCEHAEYVDCATIALDNLRARAERAEAERDALVVGIRRVLDCPCLSGASCDELDTLRATLSEPTGPTTEDAP